VYGYANDDASGAMILGRRTADWSVSSPWPIAPAPPLVGPFQSARLRAKWPTARRRSDSAARGPSRAKDCRDWDQLQQVKKSCRRSSERDPLHDFGTGPGAP